MVLNIEIKGTKKSCCSLNPVGGSVQGPSLAPFIMSSQEALTVRVQLGALNQSGRDFPKAAARARAGLGLRPGFLALNCALSAHLTVSFQSQS